MLTPPLTPPLWIMVAVLFGRTTIAITNGRDTNMALQTNNMDVCRTVYMPIF